jgi:hypothetical protein
MDPIKFIVGGLAISLTVPYLAADKATEGPNKVTLMATQAIAVSNSTSSSFGPMTVLDTMQGHVISVAPRVDVIARPAFIGQFTVKSST